MNRLDFVIKKKSTKKIDKNKLNKSVILGTLEEIYKQAKGGYCIEVMFEMSKGNILIQCWKQDDPLVHEYSIPDKALEYITSGNHSLISEEWVKMQKANFDFVQNLLVLMLAKKKDFREFVKKFEKTQTQKDINPK